MTGALPHGDQHARRSPDKGAILALYREGLTYRAIRERTGHSLSLISSVVTEAGHRPARGHPRTTSARVAVAEGLRARGFTLDRIARVMGLRSRSTVHRYLGQALPD